MMKSKSCVVTGLLMISILFLLINCAEQKPQERQQLWNGKDFSGWTLFLPGDSVAVEDVWSVKDSVIHCKGKPNGYMRTNESFSDYKLHVEWRWVEEGSNSGVLLHIQGEDKVWPNCIECQLQSGNAGDIILIGPSSVTRGDSTYAITEGWQQVPKLEDSSENPIGEWNTYDITCDGNKITSYVNDVLQNEVTDASFSEGPIALQSEGAPIEFRNVYIEPLNK